MEANKQVRKTQLNLVVGINGTGKTTFIRDTIIAKAKKALILTPDSAEWKQLPLITTSFEIRTLQGHARMIYENSGTLELIKQNFFGGILILDDAMAYLTEQTPATMQYLYIRRRQFGIDVYIVAHGLRQLPPKCFTFGSFLFLFVSTENFSDRKKELQPETFDEIIAAQKKLAEDCKKGNPYGYKIILLDPQIRATYEYARKK